MGINVRHLSAVFFKESFRYHIRRRIQRYRIHQTPWINIIIFLVIQSVIWLFVSTDNIFWKRLVEGHRIFFPHINQDRPRIGDIIRYPLQIIRHILLFLVPRHHRHLSLPQRGIQLYFKYYQRFITVLFQPEKRKKTSWAHKLRKRFHYLPKLSYAITALVSILAGLLLLLSITRFFDPFEQFIFLFILWVCTISIMDIPGRTIKLILAIFSVISSLRYLIWRYSNTLIWDDTISTFFGILLIFAETYIVVVLILGYFQSIWPLERDPVPLPKNQDHWPTVDVYFTTYDEPLSVLKPGIYSALGLDWPEDKLSIYILDDGGRAEFKTFAEETGVNYLARKDNLHAKAGNINHALKHSHSEFIAIFDCDFIPTRSFLELTMGWFLKDPKLAILQTPHHFFSDDPFEKNLDTADTIPNENQLFYSVVQDGNDTWGASYFCGSAGIFRRKVLEENGGISIGSVTEDALTSINIHRRGYHSAYIRIPLAAGLATDNLSDHLGQRIRWARGMAQILRIQNPLLAKGLSFGQRVCYFNAIMYFFSGIPRLIFFISPIAFLIFGGYIFYAPALMVVFYATPHLVQAVIANARIQGKYRHFLWNEIYETVMSYYIVIPTALAIINPKFGSFNVTEKGSLTKEKHADWHSARPYMILAVINLLGIIIGIGSLLIGSEQDIPAILITSAWAIYNLVILGGVLGAHVEAKQIRSTPRVSFAIPVALIKADGKVYPCILEDYSEQGAALKSKNYHYFSVGESITLLLPRGKEHFSFTGRIQRLSGEVIGIVFDTMTTRKATDYIQCTFARSDTWAVLKANYTIEHPINSMKEVMKLSILGYFNIFHYTPITIQKLISIIIQMFSRLRSLLPVL